MMRTTYLALFVILVLTVSVKTQQSTILSYLVEYNEEERQDFIELTVSVHATRDSLQDAIAQAREKAEQIKELQQQICRMLMKNKAQCKGSATIGNVKIEPKYERNKKDIVYEGITAAYEVLIKVINSDNFGELVDRILSLDGFVIRKIEWKPDEVPYLNKQSKIKNTFLAQSLEKSKEMCKEMGLSLKKLISVQELRDEPVQQQEEPPKEEGEEQQQQQEPEEEQEQVEEEQQGTTYRITVECTKKAGKQQKKK